MSTLSSTSTDAQVWSAYDDNASFEEDQDTGKARAFITACVILLRRRPSQTMVDGQSVSLVDVRSELTRARKWLALNRTDGGAGTRFIDFSGIRD